MSDRLVKENVEGLTVCPKMGGLGREGKGQAGIVLEEAQQEMSPSGLKAKSGYVWEQGRLLVKLEGQSLPAFFIDCSEIQTSPLPVASIARLNMNDSQKTDEIKERIFITSNGKPLLFASGLILSVNKKKTPLFASSVFRNAQS
ncbi:hypothetical protein DdX_01257 [Ditylenchus destructor]|uniref:Uncharacterized protein n=1 Tax=Ditylenchus destructor TaxID=166010 RepID=A0AAD4NLG6_9BILA|nr:hypothetical protein DdX_01257 [Ditylenchus destructor]